MRRASPVDLPEVLAVGAWLKNAACRLVDGVPQGSALHGDLGDPQACLALEASVTALLSAPSRPIAAIAHDLHPDFFSTRLAMRLATELGVPAIGVQHHHAHIAAVMAEHGLSRPVIGLALDGFGLGPDGAAWGGELLHVDERGSRRLGHLGLLALPGGDVAAREPWRMAAAALHALGRADEITARYGAAVGCNAANGLRKMLDQGLNCPVTSSAGRWFDAAAGALGLSLRQAHEAEAAIALERTATAWFEAGCEPRALALAPAADRHGVLDLRPLLAPLYDTPRERAGEAAAGFHASLVAALAEWVVDAAERLDIGTVCLGGGCFFNALLTAGLTRRLHARGLRVLKPQLHSCGDAGLAVGQAWAAALQLRAASAAAPHQPHRSSACAWPYLRA